MKKVPLELDDISTAPTVINNTTCHIPAAQRVAIVMATYNGGRFIAEQIRSIQAQSFTDWVLYIRDDGSRDDTVQKILQIEREDPRVKFVRDELGNQGAIGNFSVLMKVAFEESADYIFFSDQDDVWHPEKLATMLAAIGGLELKHGRQSPLLVHCDLAVVNEDLMSIRDSFVNLSRLSPTTADLGVLLCQNQVTGCACVINRALLKLACPVPCDVLMHDWWLALLASAAGKIGFVPKPLVKYRQHSANVIGAIPFSRRLRKLIFSPQQWKIHMEVIRLSFVQAKMLEERIITRGVMLPPIVMKQIETYSHILNVARFRRACNLHAQKIGKPTKIKGLIFDLLITAMRKKLGV